MDRSSIIKDNKLSKMQDTLAIYIKEIKGKFGEYEESPAIIRNLNAAIKDIGIIRAKNVSD